MLFYFYDEAFVHDFFEDFAVPGHDFAYDVEVTTGKPVFGVEEEEHIKLGVLELVFTEYPYTDGPPEFHEVVLHFVVNFIFTTNISLSSSLLVPQTELRSPN